MARSPSSTTPMLDRIARAIARANGARSEDDPARFDRLALTALKPLPDERKRGSGETRILIGGRCLSGLTLGTAAVLVGCPSNQLLSTDYHWSHVMNLHQDNLC